MDIDDLEREERLLAQTIAGRWWLRLPPALAVHLHADRNNAELRGSWTAVLCAILVLNSFVFSDAKLVPDVVGLAVLVRLLVLTPLALLYLPLSSWLVRRDPSTTWHHVYIAGFATATVGWMCLVQMETRVPTGAVFYIGVYLVVVFYTAALRGPLIVRAPALLIMVAMFGATMSMAPVIPTAQRLDAALSMVGICAFGLLGCYREEFSARQQFVLNRRTRLLECRRELLLSELATSNEQLSQLVTRDALTGVPNRRAIDDAMSSLTQGGPVAAALLVIDLDHFKSYNDAVGHQGGDAVLRQVAQAMAEVVRDDEALLARYGGEEFVAILRGVDAIGARRAAERVRQAVLEQGILLPDAVLHASGQRFVSVSVGGAWTSSSRMCSAALLLARADAALYEAKAAGRNMVRFYALCDDARADVVVPLSHAGDPIAG